MTRKIEYIVGNNIHCLSDAVNLMRCDVMQLQDMAEDSKDGAEFLSKVNNALTAKSPYRIDRETSGYVRLVSIDPMGNRCYLIAYK